jgi:hypothetical protein
MRGIEVWAAFEKKPGRTYVVFNDSTGDQLLFCVVKQILIYTSAGGNIYDDDIK